MNAAMFASAAPRSALRTGVLRERNAALVFELIASQGAVSRAEVAEALGLSPGAVTKIVSQLFSGRLIGESLSPTEDREPGRPRIPLALDREYFRVGGVHIGLRRTTVGLTDVAGRPVVEHVIEHSSTDPGVLIDEATTLLGRLRSQLGDRLLTVGFCTGGRVDSERGRVLSHPLLGWHDESLAPIAQVARCPVFYDTSVRAHAQAEVRFGSGRGARDVLYLYAGNIVGAAHVVDGVAARGAHGAAGGIDHLTMTGRGLTCACGRQTCLWSLVSDVAVTASAREQGIISGEEHMSELLERAASDDHPHASAASALLTARAQRIGEAVAKLAELFDPQLVVVGGTVSADHELEEIRQSAAAWWPPGDAPRWPIVATGLADAPLVRAAATTALAELYRAPLSFVSKT